MVRTKLSPAFIVLAALASAAALPVGAQAGTYRVHFCDAESGYQAPLGPEWTVRSEGGSYNATQPGTSLTCSAQMGPQSTLAGVGGWIAGAVMPGSISTAVFTPPSGARVVGLFGQRQVFVKPGSMGEASVFTSSGRPLDDTASQLAGGSVYDPGSAIQYGLEQLGSDGQSGVSWGARCPQSLPSGYTICGSASYGLYGYLTLADDSPPTATLAASVATDGSITAVWSAGDPQSGIRDVELLAGDSVIDGRQGTCDVRQAHQCTATYSATVGAGTIAPGQTMTLRLGVSNAAGDQAVRTVAVSRAVAPAPAPAPVVTSQGAPGSTPAPSPTPAPDKAPLQGTQGGPLVGFAIQRRGKTKLRLVGTARGCTAVSVRTPGRRIFTVRLKSDGWSLTVKRRPGRYTAVCGAARFSRSV